MKLAPDLRNDREILIAIGILLGVLVVIDAGALAQPALVLSLLPLVFLVALALLPLEPWHVLLWMAGVGIVALVVRQPRYLGLGYPAAIVLVLMLVQRRRRGPP